MKVAALFALVTSSLGVALEPPTPVTFSLCGHPSRAHEVCVVKGNDRGKTYLYLRTAHSPRPPVFGLATVTETRSGTRYEACGVSVAENHRESTEVKMELVVTRESDGRIFGRYIHQGMGDGIRFELRR